MLGICSLLLIKSPQLLIKKIWFTVFHCQLFSRFLCDVQLQEQLPTAIHILNQALKLTEDMALPTAPPLLSEPKKKEQSGQEKTPSEPGSTDDNTAQSMEVDGTDKDKAERDANTKNGSKECEDGASCTEKMETSTEEVVKVKKDDIIAQVCCTCTYMLI